MTNQPKLLHELLFQISILSEALSKQPVSNDDIIRLQLISKLSKIMIDMEDI